MYRCRHMSASHPEPTIIRKISGLWSEEGSLPHKCTRAEFEMKSCLHAS